MGMQGSEMALAELMRRVLGHLFEEGVVTKIADDLYSGGNNRHDLLQNPQKVLLALYKCDPRLSASKTVFIFQTTVLGWVWHSSTVMIRFSALCPISAPFRIRAPLRMCVY